MSTWLVFILITVVFFVLVSKLTQQANNLKQQVKGLTERLAKYEPKPESPKRLDLPPKDPPDRKRSPARKDVSPFPDAGSMDFHFKNEPSASEPPAPPPAPAKPKARRWRNLAQGALERNFGTRLPVWLGGIALAFAGFFLVKYSLDNNLISPEMRVVISGVFGMVLLFLAEWGRRRGIGNQIIPQALAGAGGAVLYGVAFAATSVYHFISLPWGLAAITAITGLMALFSLNLGPIMAVLGMVCGFVSLWLIGATAIPAPFFFGYLILLFASIMATIRHRGWWRLSLPTMAGVLLWATGRTLLCWHDDSIWVWLFSVILAGITILTVHGPLVALPEFDKRRRLLRVLLWSGTIAPFGLMVLSMLTNRHGYTGLDLCLLGGLALGGAILAYWKEEFYGVLPWLSLVTLPGLLLNWDTADLGNIALFTTGFGVLHAAYGLSLLRRSPRSWVWACLACIATLAAFGIAWFRFDMGMTEPHPHFWSIPSSILAALSGLAFFLIIRRKDHQSATPFLVTAATFASLALAFEFHGTPLFLAWAGVMLVLAGTTRLFPLPAAKPLVGLMAVLAGFPLLLPVLTLVLGMEALQLKIAYAPSGMSLLLSDWSLATGQYGLVAALKTFGGPALLFGATSWLVCGRGEHVLSKILDVVAAAFATACLYGLLNTVFSDWNFARHLDLAFLQRNITTNLLFILAMATALIGARTGRNVLSRASACYLLYALFRVLFWDLLIHNPLLTGEYVGGWPVFNGLLLSLGLPAVWIAGYVRLRGLQANPMATHLRNGSILFLLFVLLTLNVRFWFHAPYLTGDAPTDLEIYAYSAAWLVYGLALLWLGIAKQSRPVRFASLGVMVITVLKVFLYDASELEGLYRVVSFFGLGISLIGLGFFYSKYLLTGSRQAKEDAEA